MGAQVRAWVAVGLVFAVGCIREPATDVTSVGRAIDVPCDIQWLLFELNKQTASDLTLSLTPGCVYEAETINNTDQGPNGLPKIITHVTIEGNGATILRDSPQDFRLFRVLPTGHLAASDLTVSDGFVLGDTNDTDDPAFGVDGRGGAIYAEGDVTLTRVTLSNNSAVGGAGIGGDKGHGGFGQGGAIYHVGGALTLSQVTLSENSVSGGPGSGLEFGDGRSGQGGALYHAGGSLSISRTTFSDNLAVGGPASSDTVAIAGNGQGGALFVSRDPVAPLLPTVVVANSTFHANATDVGVASGIAPTLLNGNAQGGAVYVENTGAELSFLTMTGNSAELGGGAVEARQTASGTFVHIRNSILAGSLTGADCTQSQTAPEPLVTSIGATLIQGDTNCALVEEGWTFTDPLLEPLAYHGGGTLTQIPMVGSPAIDQGSCQDAAGNDVVIDQRGVPRPVGTTCDIGAYEVGDDDECDLGLDDCHADATCTNVIGTFTCACNDGFVGDGRTCEPAPVVDANPKNGGGCGTAPLSAWLLLPLLISRALWRRRRTRCEVA